MKFLPYFLVQMTFCRLPNQDQIHSHLTWQLLGSICLLGSTLHAGYSWIDTSTSIPGSSGSSLRMKNCQNWCFLHLMTNFGANSETEKTLSKTHKPPDKSIIRLSAYWYRKISAGELLDTIWRLFLSRLLCTLDKIFYISTCRQPDNQYLVNTLKIFSFILYGNSSLKFYQVWCQHYDIYYNPKVKRFSKNKLINLWKKFSPNEKLSLAL